MSKILIIYIRHIAFLILIVLLFNVACKKYEEGPYFSLITKKGRLCKEWNVQKFFYNENDSTASFCNKIGYSFSFGTERFDNSSHKTGHPLNIKNDSMGQYYSGWWDLVKDKKELEIDFFYTFTCPEYGPFGKNRRLFFEICKLTSHDLILECSRYGINYRIELSTE
ncbi:MAG: hypothetical protein Kow0068_01560 [Marinilabiliales bacterium]